MYLLVCRDSNASALSGIWLHRQQADDLSSADDDCACSEEDDLEPAATSVPGMESGCQILDRADIAVFDTLLSVSPDVGASTRSNVELLSMLSADDLPTATSTADVPQCDGAACGSLADAGHGLCGNDEIDGIDTNDTLVAESDSSDIRPQTGSVIERGSGDLTISPVHHSAIANSSVQTVSFPNACTSFGRSKLSSRSWKSDASSLSSNEETRYIVEAAELISQAQEHEIGENYPAAYSHYRSGIEILVKGVQSERFHLSVLFSTFWLEKLGQSVNQSIYLYGS